MTFSTNYDVCWTTTGNPAAALVGLGGMGKTQIALEYCYRNFPSKYQYVFWILAESKQALDISFAKVARLLEIPVEDKEEPALRISLIKQWFENAKQRWLLVFDNADDDLDIDYIPSLGNGDVIFTSRNSITDYNASTINLDVMKMGMDSALSLLLRTEDVLNSGENAESRAIIKELDHLPLAIDLAGAYTCRRFR
ncbi:P-loop containing nucleoside triphosphate hydrolase protein [Jimgerdemannia flammicorona]|uniref:P-loop containing nucleoside triphosphate hydrolase protein n=1 Tax=Jimgerdemannia flammicorona TaxID=994334 RepID=A0A433DK34_9FUNG|nr:P-loop containing nucleoside triphosphate hydrolase protein [Jimgerdemannia flammicorona]